MTIAYELGDSLYLNITNRCINECKFCVRDYKDGVGGYNLWLDEEPTTDEVIAAIKEKKNPSQYEEVVFCGYGEPLVRLEVVIKVAEWLRNYDVPIRIDTNGQANLIHERNIAPDLEGLVDVISISLNAKNANKYQQLCNSEFGSDAFKAILKFAEECKEYIPQVILTVVNYPTTSIYECRKIASNLGVDFRVRQYNGPDMEKDE